MTQETADCIPLHHGGKKRRFTWIAAKNGGGGEGKVQLSHTKTIYPNVMSTSPMWIFSRFLTFACCAINNNHEKKSTKGQGSTGTLVMSLVFMINLIN